jgi:hypothetical protein
MATRRPRESKQALVIALVFAVLTVIGLGVTAYMQAGAKDAALKDATEEKRKAAEMTEDRDWYKFQALLFRSYMGQNEGIEPADLTSLRGRFDTGSLGSKSKDKEYVSKVIKETLDPKLQWDAAQNRPRESYESLLQREKVRSDSAEKLSADAQSAREAAEKSSKKATDDLKAERGAFDAKLAELNKKTEVDMSRYLDTIKELRAEITRMGENNDQIRKTASDDKKRAEDAVARMNGKNKELLSQLDVKKNAIEELKNKGVDLAPKGWQTDWRIVSIDRTGQQPYINLGSADRIQPQLTFSVHAQGPDGRPVAESKGSLEVVTVLGEHLSQTRLLTVKDRNREPILKGDLLYNPNWSPTLRKHVALVGTIDLAGDGRDATFEFIRNLERYNVTVDAFVDPRDNTIKGKGITVQTDYIIQGTPGSEGQNASERVQEGLKKREEESGKLLKLARENGVQPVSLTKYLEMIGYRVPRVARELGAPADQAGAAAPSAIPPEASPDAKKDDKAPADEKMDNDKPKDDKPKDDKPK